MKRFIVFWKRDIINKLIFIISLLITIGGGVFMYMVITMPEGKSLSDAFSQQRPLPPMATSTDQDLTEYPKPTITTMAFNIPETPTLVDINVSPTLASLPSPSPTSAGVVISSPMPALSLALSTPTLIAVTPFISGNNDCIPNSHPQIGKVVDIIDGSTIKVLINDLVYVVRYIGVSAPNDRIYSQTAMLENSKLVFRKEITLITDVSDKDARGRLLRYVKVEDVFINLNLIQKGLGSAVDVPPDSACAQVFKEAEQLAVNSHLGKWSATPTAKVFP